MEARTLEALKASIAKWERNAEAKTPEDYLIGAKDCPLCNLFNTLDMPSENACQECPVFAATSLECCEGTPFDAASTAHWAWEESWDSGTAAETAHQAARAEVDFLKSLLPTEPAP